MNLTRNMVLLKCLPLLTVQSSTEHLYFAVKSRHKTQQKGKNDNARDAILRRKLARTKQKALPWRVKTSADSDPFEGGQTLL